jgi:hypothetical protein
MGANGVVWIGIGRLYESENTDVDFSQSSSSLPGILGCLYIPQEF